jgi:LmbE family N-acetylglucosaminyl deacetylase
MLRVEFHKQDGEYTRILCLGAHSDDIEIGCGGTILRLLADRRPLDFTWIIFGAGGQRGREAKRSASLLLEKAKKRRIEVLRFRDGFFPYNGHAIKEYFEQMKRNVDPHIIFTHCRHDLHQDHRLISELTWNTYRDHLILEYEILKYDGDLGKPNFYVHLDESICKKKIDHIRSCFVTQRKKPWFSDDAFYSILRLRGVESNAPSGHAEGFYGRKVIF